MNEERSLTVPPYPSGPSAGRGPLPPFRGGQDSRIEDGLQLFARYAYPPNERGYCGPDDARELLEYRTAGVTDGGLGKLARAFHGPWPYLTLMAEVTGIEDPFDRRLVEAYWIGNPILDRVDVTSFGNALDDRFRRRVGGKWSLMAESIPVGSIPHHSFHVFGVYPWVGLLDSGRGEPLDILDRCRIRWGKVIDVLGDVALVMSRHLAWDDRRLYLGEPTAETVTLTVDGLGFTGGLAPGDWVTMHWSWVCDRVDRPQLAALRHYSARQLDIVNARIDHPGPAMVLG